MMPASEQTEMKVRSHSLTFRHHGDSIVSPTRTRDAALIAQTDSDNMPCGAPYQSATGNIKSLADLNRANRKAYGLEPEMENEQ